VVRDVYGTSAAARGCRCDVSAPRISIVLPTRNGGATLPGLLDAIARQRVDTPVEIVVVDSGSTDGSAELLRHRADRFVSIAPAAFDHGLTRNLGIQHAAGELIVLTVQDAVPASDRWLEALTEPLLADSRVAGAFARQTPRPGASAVTRYYLDRYQASSDVRRTIAIGSRLELESLAPGAQLDVCTFDNVCSCIRRSIWAQHPFRPTPIGEDIEWAREVLIAGYRLAYVPEAAVVHSHDRSGAYEFERTYLLHRRLYELFGLRTIPTLPLLARAIGATLRVHHRCERAERPALVMSQRALALAFAWPLGQYLGGLAGVHGWKAIRTRHV
jgi:glycosyltransferase involved in cell wall biosynthesis